MNSSDSYNMEMAFGPGGLSSGGGGNGGPGSGHQRTKRMRTSFKHHQLRTMKSYFHHNHNPDAKDLKQLSQKTGLPKRVLQVNIVLELRVLIFSSPQFLNLCFPNITFLLFSMLFYYGISLMYIEQRINAIQCDNANDGFSLRVRVL